MEREGLFPADYICEAVDQTRGWFYSLHALSTLLKGEPSYKNVICLGLILDERGRKMSKRTGNVVEPLPVLDEHGAGRPPVVPVHRVTARRGTPPSRQGWSTRRCGRCC